MLSQGKHLLTAFIFSVNERYFLFLCMSHIFLLKWIFKIQNVATLKIRTSLPQWFVVAVVFIVLFLSLLFVS